MSRTARKDDTEGVRGRKKKNDRVRKMERSLVEEERQRGDKNARKRKIQRAVCDTVKLERR